MPSVTADQASKFWTSELIADMAEHNTPEVAVIIPTHNRWPLVSEAIESVLAQDYPATRCIVVDDASTDGSAEQIARRYGDRITLLTSEQNREKSACRNRGVRESNAELICFLDSDDLLLPKAVSERVRIFTSAPEFDGVAFGAKVNEERKDDPPPEMPAVLTLKDYIRGFRQLHTNTFMLRRQTMLKVGMFDERLTNREDVELFIRLLAQMEFRSCGSAIAVLRSGASDRARTNWRKIIRQRTAMTDALSEHRDLLPALGEHFTRLRSEEYQELLRALFRCKDYDGYRHTFRQAQGPEGLQLPFRFHRRYWIASALGALRRKQFGE